MSMSRKSRQHPETSPAVPLKGSDFFPPGAGWNAAKKPPQSDDAPVRPAEKYSERQKH